MAKIRSANANKEYGVLGEGAFGVRLTKFTTKVELHLRQKIALCFFEAFKDIVDGTPIDTTRAQASWKCTVKETDLDNEENAKYIDKYTGEFKTDESIVAGYPSRDEVLETGAENLNLFLEYKQKKVRDRRTKTGWGKRDTAVFKTRGPINITNTVPYMARLEGGYSSQNALWIKVASDELSRKLKEPREDLPNYFGKKKAKFDGQLIKVKDKDKAQFLPTGTKPKKDTYYEDRQPDIEISDVEAEWLKSIAGTEEGKKFLIEEERYKKESKRLVLGGEIEGKSAFTREGQWDAGKSSSVRSGGENLKPKRNDTWDLLKRFEETKKSKKSKRKSPQVKSLQKTKKKQTKPTSATKRTKPKRIKANPQNNVFENWQRELRRGLGEPKKDKSKGGFWKPEG